MTRSRAVRAALGFLDQTVEMSEEYDDVDDLLEDVHDAVEDRRIIQ